MIKFGKNTVTIKIADIADRCQYCGTQHSMQMNILQKYFDIFWIPFFPTGKTASTSCSHCKQVLSKKEFSESLLKEYEMLKGSSRTPVWTFSGLIILAVLIGWGIIHQKQQKVENAGLILNPAKGDIYEIKTGAGQYTLYKVDGISGDTVMMLYNQMEVNKWKGLKDLKKQGDKLFDGERNPLLKSELQQMLDDGIILDIER